MIPPELVRAYLAPCDLHAAMRFARASTSNWARYRAAVWAAYREHHARIVLRCITSCAPRFQLDTIKVYVVMRRARRQPTANLERWIADLRRKVRNIGFAFLKESYAERKMKFYDVTREELLGVLMNDSLI